MLDEIYHAVYWLYEKLHPKSKKQKSKPENASERKQNTRHPTIAKQKRRLKDKERKPKQTIRHPITVMTSFPHRKCTHCNGTGKIKIIKPPNIKRINLPGSGIIKIEFDPKGKPVQVYKPPRPAEISPRGTIQYEQCKYCSGTGWCI